MCFEVAGCGRMDTLPFWKKIYQTVTGYSGNITNDIVEEILKLSKDGLLNGILTYKPFKNESFQEWSQHSSKIDSDVRSFVRRLSKDLNLDANCAWLTLCNYLMFEYFGKIKDIKLIARYESNSAILARNVWHFYSAERMFIIRTLRHIFECVADDSHQFYNEYQAFIQTLDFKKFKENLILQFGKLVEEISYDTVSNTELLEPWVYRNNREQAELLMLITIITEYIKFDVDDFNTLFSSFMKHSFTRHPLYFESTLTVPHINFFNVKCAEIGCFVSLLNQFLQSDNTEKFLNKNVENQLLEIQVQGNQTVVLFIWIILKLKSIDSQTEDPNQMSYVNNLVTLLQKDVFSSLYEIICNSIFTENRAGDVVYKSIFEIINQLLYWCPDHKMIYCYNGSVQVMNQMIKHKTVMLECINGKSGLNSLARIAYNAFPYDFFSFTKLSEAMLLSGVCTKDTLKKLYNLCSFLSGLSATAPDGEYYTLNEEYIPFEHVPGFKFTSLTRVQSYELFGKNLARFIKQYNYFTLIETLLLSLLHDAKRTNNLNRDLVLKIVDGYGLVNIIIKDSKIYNEEIEPLHSCIDVANLIWPLISQSKLCNFDLIKMYFELETNLVMYRKGHFKKEFINIFLPKINKSNLTISNMMCKDIYEKSITLTYLHEEESKNVHTFLLQYLELIHYSIENNTCHETILLPGVTYIMNHIFPFFENWSYNNDDVKAAIELKCLLVFHKILQSQNSNEVQKKIFEFVTQSFFNNSVVVQAYFNLLAKGNTEIQNIMTTSILPPKNKDTEMFKSVRLQLAILLFLIKLESCVNNTSFFYEKLKAFVKPLTSFIGNPFNSHVAQLSCRLVEVIARDSDIPMLALLEMDYHQVQSFFLERLRDPMEDEELKLIIIDLIDTCIKNQHGMTAAFFNIPTNKQWNDNSEKDKMSDTMTDFMLDYLQNIKKNPQLLENPLQLGILKILLNLWTNRKSNLIQEVVALKQFWPLLANPLYCTFNPNPEIYSIVFKIISLHLCSTSCDIDVNLKQTIEKFFRDKHQMEKWMSYMDSTFEYVPASEKDDVARKNEFLLNSWVEFIIVTKKYIPEAFDPAVKIILIEHCLDGALYHYTVPSHIKAPVTWMELYLMLITDWKLYDNREKMIVNKFSTILLHFTSNMQVLPYKTRKIYLAVIYNTIVGLKTFFEDNPTMFEKLLIPVGKILSFEYDELYYLLWNSSKESVLQYKVINWVLTINVANAIMELKTINQHSVWFRLNKYIEKITSAFRPLFYNQKTTTVVKFMLDSLIRYAQTPMVYDFLSSDVIKITENMKTPENFYLWKESNENIIPIYLREWCTSYMLLVKLLHILVKKLGYKMVNNTCLFLMIHDKIITDILLLIEHSADKTALILIREILNLVNTLMTWKYLWYCHFKDSFLSLITGIKKCLNACISALLRPNNLLCYSVGESGRLEILQEIPQTQLVAVANIYVEISCLASQCLLKANRTLLDYFDVYKSYDPVFEIIENDFRVPRFELPVSSNVTFGRLLCLVHFLCKTLHQLPSTSQSPDGPDKSPESLLSFSIKNQFEDLPDLLNHYNAQTEDAILFVQYEENANIYSNQKLSAFFRYAMYEYTGLSASWIGKLNRNMVEKTLEILMSFLASQIFLYTRIMDNHQLPQYKRELCAELLFITEFVKKKASDQNSLKLSSNKHLSKGSKESNAKIVDKDISYLVIISEWFVNICQLYSDSYYTY